MNAIRIILEVLGWLMIVFGTTSAAALIAFFIYSNWPNEISKIISLTLIVTGFLCGARWATKIWKRTGTIEWLSRITSIS